jgi:DNA polymerase-3 subunit gamma/tau
MLVKVSGASKELLDKPEEEMAGLSEIAARNSLETISNAFHLLLKAVEEMQYSSLPKMVLEMAFVKITTAGDLVSLATLLERLVSLAAGGQFAENEGGGRAALPAAQEAAAPAGPPLAVSPEPEQQGRPGLPEKAKEKSAAPPGAEQVPETETEAAVPRMVEEKEVRKHWDGFLEHVKDRKPWMAHALSLCASAREKDHELVLKYDDLSECKILQGAENSKLLNEYVLDFFQKSLKVKIISKSGNSLADETDSDLNLPQEERRALGNDPLVQLTAEILGGQVSGIRTGPRSR